MAERQDTVTAAKPAQATALVGAAWMLASILFNTAELVLVHWLGPDWPAPVQLFWRQATALLLLLPLILPDPRGALRITRPKIVVFRSLAAMSALLLTVYAFSRLPIATANALTFTRPLFIVVLAALLLGEKIGIWRGGAVLFGFAGVLVMVAPGAAFGELSAELAVLAASLLFAASFVSIKSMTSDNRTVTILIYGVLFGLAMSVVPAMLWWRWPSPLEAACLVGLGVTSLGTFASVTKAMKAADAIALVTIDYLRLPLATGLGILLFSERPTWGLLFGGLMIVAATATVTIRERVRKSR